MDPLFQIDPTTGYLKLSILFIHNFIPLEIDFLIPKKVMSNTKDNQSLLQFLDSLTNSFVFINNHNTRITKDGKKSPFKTTANLLKKLRE